MIDEQARSAHRRPKLGLALLSAEWFYDRGEAGTAIDSARALGPIVRRDVEELVARVSVFADPVHPHLITTAEQAEPAAAAYRQANIDGLIICPMTWSQDEPLLRILDATVGTPTLVWCYCGLAATREPLGLVELFHGSGPVGALQSSALIRRSGRRVEVVVGHHASEAAMTGIRDFAMAASCAADLRRSRIGVLPHRCEVMSGTWVDEFALRRRIGPSLEPITTSAYEQICNDLPEVEVDTFLAWVRTTYNVKGMTDASLEQSARASIGLAELFRRYKLDALAYNDTNQTLLKNLGVRAGLYVPELFARGGVIAMEADVGAATAMWMLQKMTGRPPMYTEIQNYDLADNSVLLSHAGMHDFRLAVDPKDIVITADPEFAEVNELKGAFGEYRVQPGSIAMVNFIQGPEGFQMTVTLAESLAGPVRLRGFPHIEARMDTPLPVFFEKAIRRGVTQHWIVAHDPDVVPRLQTLSRIVGFEIERI
jgi:L-arabinose isomerase